MKNTALGFAACFLLTITFVSCKSKQTTYVCTPCDLPCDSLTFSGAGVCPHCHMQLVKQSDVIEKEALVLNAINIEEGSGAFLVEGGRGHKDKAITVYYHKPKNFHARSPVLIVVPGAGRNGDSYRDAWVAASEKYSVLILSPQYPEQDYDFGAYHMGGLVYDMQLADNITYIENSNEVVLDEEHFTFKVSARAEEWIFNDFDRLFENVVKATGSSQTQYAIFGHSAGGQILHRFVLFDPDSKANRILASNAGFYTLPDFETALPFGLKNTPLKVESLRAAFKKHLVVFIGELDNEDEQGGTLLRSPSADLQGRHRLARGEFFYNTARAKAEAMGTDFHWELRIVPNIGHNQQGMGEAAAKYLYDDKN